jgi:hypothetical protein
VDRPSGWKWNPPAARTFPRVAIELAGGLIARDPDADRDASVPSDPVEMEPGALASTSFPVGENIQQHQESESLFN